MNNHLLNLYPVQAKLSYTEGATTEVTVTQNSTNLHLTRSYSLTFTVIVLPLGSSKRSIVFMSIMNVKPNVMMRARMKVTKSPDQIGVEVKPTQS